MIDAIGRFVALAVVGATLAALGAAVQAAIPPSPPDTVPALKAQVAELQQALAAEKNLNAIVARGIRKCQVQRNAAQDQALDDAMNAVGPASQ